MIYFNKKSWTQHRWIYLVSKHWIKTPIWAAVGLYLLVAVTFFTRRWRHFSKTKEKLFLHVITRQWNESRSYYLYSKLALIYDIFYKNSKYSNQRRDAGLHWHFIFSVKCGMDHSINDSIISPRLIICKAQISTKFNENTSNSPKIAIRLSFTKYCSSEHGIPLKASAHYSVLYFWYAIKNLFIFCYAHRLDHV